MGQSEYNITASFSRLYHARSFLFGVRRPRALDWVSNPPQHSSIFSFSGSENSHNPVKMADGKLEKLWVAIDVSSAPAVGVKRENLNAVLAACVANMAPECAGNTARLLPRVGLGRGKFPTAGVCIMLCCAEPAPAFVSSVVCLKFRFAAQFK